jgi:hypothetical protein
MNHISKGRPNHLTLVSRGMNPGGRPQSRSAVRTREAGMPGSRRFTRDGARSPHQRSARRSAIQAHAVLPPPNHRLAYIALLVSLMIAACALIVAYPREAAAMELPNNTYLTDLAPGTVIEFTQSLEICGGVAERKTREGYGILRPRYTYRLLAEPSSDQLEGCHKTDQLTRVRVRAVRSYDHEFTVWLDHPELSQISVTRTRRFKELFQMVPTTRNDHLSVGNLKTAFGGKIRVLTSETYL